MEEELNRIVVVIMMDGKPKVTTTGSLSKTTIKVQFTTEKETRENGKRLGEALQGDAVEIAA